jgi:hypothetical protein
MSHKNIGLQFFVWAWEVNPSKLNVCKLFWGTVFLPLGFFSKKRQRPFYCLSPLAAVWLTCLAIPSLFLGRYTSAIALFLLVLCSIFCNYLRRETIAKRCNQEEVKLRELEAKKEMDDCHFSARTERILDIIFNPIFWIIALALETAEKFYRTRPGEQITGLLSLFYYFLKSVKQRVCLPVKIE